MDLITVRGLRVNTILGVYAWERVAPRPVVIDIELAATSTRPFEDDSIKELVNYATVSERVEALLQTLSCRTVERLAEIIAQTLLTEFKTPWVKIRLDKPGAVASAQSVGVVIERRAPDT